MSLRLFAVTATLAAALSAASAQTSAVSITDAWARATPAGATTGAAYFTVESPVGDRLVSASTPAAKHAELHEMTMTGNGVMTMRALAHGLALPAGKAVTLKPGGMHVMLTGLAAPLTEGQSFPLTLNFAKSGTAQVTVAVAKIGAMGPDGGTGGMTTPMHH